MPWDWAGFVEAENTFESRMMLRLPGVHLLEVPCGVPQAVPTRGRRNRSGNSLYSCQYAIAVSRHEVLQSLITCTHTHTHTHTWS